MNKCRDCKKRMWNWQPKCEVMLEGEKFMYDYHKRCFKRNHYKEWKFFHPKDIIRIFNGQKVPKTGYYLMIEHRKDCDKILNSEHVIFMVKGSEAHRPIACQHDVKWELISPSYD